MDDFDAPDYGDDFGSSPDFDASAFSVGGSSSDDPMRQNRYCLPRRFRPQPIYAVKHNNARVFVRDILPHMRKGFRVDAVLGGNFIFGDIFEAFSVEANTAIDDLTLSTLSFSAENVDSWGNMLRADRLRSLNIVVSDVFWSHNRINAPRIFEALDYEDRTQIAVAGVHTKISLLNIAGYKLVIRGSANMRSSRSVEEISIEASETLYDFHMDWHKTILDQYATIRKSVRAQALYDMITRSAKGKPWNE